ncbi:hypothetical protein A3J77_02290 [Candidatus Wolfebacteria bacterium RBG_13_41_7]|uniref:Protease PrsW n=1 Tax=Candidatus Wolfebacteria bacterium RBG_13_41_7 TaxID=1802554 RepID=A0A1F8DP54_9BACT|nr:MAG: hypothetical protein A3J77_02290 [Candidatus Wolfebacteria bacterium RBG_13_41_7]
MVILYALFFILGLLPSFAWLVFFLKEDVHPEPKKMLLKVFLLGFFITFIVIAIQFLFQDIFSFYKIAGGNPFSLFVFALSEEVLKFLAVYFVIRKSKFFDEPVDAMIYMITAALGFAMLENLAIMFSITGVSEALGVITIRFVGATLLHALSSAIVGYWWAKGLIATRKPEFHPNVPNIPEKSSGTNSAAFTVWGYVAAGIAIATILHTFFNYLIMTSEDAIVYPIIFLTIVAMFIFWDFEQLKAVH